MEDHELESTLEHDEEVKYKFTSSFIFIREAMRFVIVYCVVIALIIFLTLILSIVFHFLFLILAIALLCIFGLGLLMLILMHRGNDTYIFTNKRLVIQKQLPTKRNFIIEYSSIDRVVAKENVDKYGNKSSYGEIEIYYNDKSSIKEKIVYLTHIENPIEVKDGLYKLLKKEDRKSIEFEESQKEDPHIVKKIVDVK